MCNDTGEEFEDTKMQIKEACNHIKTAISIVKFLSLNIPTVFALPIKDGKSFGPLFKDYNKYLFSIFDLHFHMIQVEYPFGKKMAYELAAKMMSHCSLIIEESVKPNIRTLQEYFKKDKEFDLFYTYSNILHTLCICLKWLARGLNHGKSDEKEECYSAINEAKMIGQK